MKSLYDDEDLPAVAVAMALILLVSTVLAITFLWETFK